MTTGVWVSGQTVEHDVGTFKEGRDVSRHQRLRLDHTPIQAIRVSHRVRSLRLDHTSIKPSGFHTGFVASG